MKKIAIALVVILLAVFGAILLTGKHKRGIAKNGDFDKNVDNFIADTVEELSKRPVDIRVADKSLGNFYTVKMDNKLSILCSDDFMEDIMGCSVNQYPSGKVLVERRNTKLEFSEMRSEVYDGTEKVELNTPVIKQGGTLYIPIQKIVDRLGYTAQYNFAERAVNFVNQDGGTNLPRYYDLRKEGRVTPVRDQGFYGTCWAFASLGAVESTQMPTDKTIYSVEHMTMNNSYSVDIQEGGEHTMSIAYLAAWQGPVREEDDPYGDGETNHNLKAQKHLEEAIIMNERDDTVVKNAIFKYGGVESSIYMDVSYGSDESEYYNDATSAYYYDGDATPNHDIVIVGWDDDYDKDNFKKKPKNNGAYICKNSWGNKFGEGGYFYISYEDTHIAAETIVYTKVANADNFDNIYQTDLLGWVGQSGFRSDTAYFANVYTSKKDEDLSAVSFYATGPNTTFKVYYVENFKDTKSFDNRVKVAEGETRYQGYYTMRLPEKQHLKAGQKFAVVVEIHTPDATKPIAIECEQGARTKNITLTDGEGYMSYYGEVWHSAEKENCNVCLKAFTDNVEPEVSTAGDAGK